MATYILCHGGWAGSWQWKQVATLLRAAGHEVYTPTFTGLGERVHLANPGVDMTTYITDILMVMKYEDLKDVILVGYSMSGLVVTGVAEKAADRIRCLVYVDAYVPQDGQSLADIIGPDIMAGLKQTAQQFGDGWKMPHMPPDSDRHTDQSINVAYTPLVLKNPAAAAIPRLFILCAEGARDVGPLHLPIEQAAVRIKADARWTYRELPTGHMPMWTMPRELADFLLEVVDR